MNPINENTPTPEPPPTLLPFSLQATGSPHPPHVSDTMTIGPCDKVDPGLVRLLADCAQALYNVVGALRIVNPLSEKDKNALLQILVSSVAIAATEAETLAVLCSLGLCTPARIHARALGDLAKRIMHLRTDLAVRMYDAAEATRVKLFKTADDDHWARIALERDFDGPMVTMEQLENGAYRAAPRTKVDITDFERKAWSKWNHGDILALVEAGRRLLNADQRVRSSLGHDEHIDFTLHRGVGFVLGILIRLNKLFPALQLSEAIDELNDCNAVFADRFNAQFKAMDAARTQAR